MREQYTTAAAVSRWARSSVRAGTSGCGVSHGDRGPKLGAVPSREPDHNTLHATPECPHTHTQAAPVTKRHKGGAYHHGGVSQGQVGPLRLVHRSGQGHVNGRTGLSWTRGAWRAPNSRRHGYALAITNAHHHHRFHNRRGACNRCRSIRRAQLTGQQPSHGSTPTHLHRLPRLVKRTNGVKTNHPGL